MTLTAKRYVISNNYQTGLEYAKERWPELNELEIRVIIPDTAYMALGLHWKELPPVVNDPNAEPFPEDKMNMLKSRVDES